MVRVRTTKHGVYCNQCDSVYGGTDGCEHELADKSGVTKENDQYRTLAEDMGHYGPHQWIDVDGKPMCAECGAVILPAEMIQD